MILCVGANPAIDRSIVVPSFKVNAVNRSVSSMDAAGGKSINVARAAQLLGEQARCAGFLGGETGQRIARLVDAEGCESRWTWISGETRTCTIIIDEETGGATVVNDNGPLVSAADWERLQTDVLAAAQEVSCVCVSGSLPPGSPQEAYQRLLRRLQETGLPLWVDASGATLQTALTIPGLAIKVNHEEIAAVLGQTVADADSALTATELLRQGGAGTVVVTLGAPGAIMAHESGWWWAQPTPIRVISGVGSGDSFLAGLVAALSKGENVADALRWAVAAGTANALSVGGGQFSKADFERILGDTTVTAL